MICSACNAFVVTLPLTYHVGSSSCPRIDVLVNLSVTIPVNMPVNLSVNIPVNVPRNMAC